MFSEKSKLQNAITACQHLSTLLQTQAARHYTTHGFIAAEHASEEDSH